MKLVLANNQSDRFQTFYNNLREQSGEAFDYAAYQDVLFYFDPTTTPGITVQQLGTGKALTAYDGVYLNGYLDTYELAATLATCCSALGIPFVNRELADAPSLSKLTAYAKLAAAGVPIPRTAAGAKAALLQAANELASWEYPLVLKRADADRGIDNYKVHSWQEAEQLLADHEPRSLWILQAFIPNDGFHLVSFYDQKPVFGIFRSLEARPDGNEQKAHMYKPKGGTNATLLDVPEIPATVLATCQKAIDTMNRQIGSVDCLYNEATDQAYVLEVNYNPQLVTIETFKEKRIDAFLNGIGKIV